MQTATLPIDLSFQNVNLIIRLVDPLIIVLQMRFDLIGVLFERCESILYVNLKGENDSNQSAEEDEFL